MLLLWRKLFKSVPDFGILNIRMEVRNRNHSVLTVTHCPTLIALEEEDVGREDSICNLVEPKVFKDYASFFNPDIEVKCLKSPPRKSKNEICCQWEFKLEK